MQIGQFDTATELLEDLKTKMAIILQPGKAFGVSDHYVRIAVPFNASSHFLATIVQRLQLYSSSLQARNSEKPPIVLAKL